MVFTLAQRNILLLVSPPKSEPIHLLTGLNALVKSICKLLRRTEREDSPDFTISCCYGSEQHWSQKPPLMTLLCSGPIRYILRPGCPSDFEAASELLKRLFLCSQPCAAASLGECIAYISPEDSEQYSNIDATIQTQNMGEIGCKR